MKELSPGFWGMLVLTGVSVGVVGGLLMRLLRATEHLAFGYSSGELLYGASHATPGRRVATLIAAGLVAAAGGLLASAFKGDTDINGAVWRGSGRLPILKSSIRAVYSIVVVGMGAAVGRENALKQAGGILGNLSATWSRLPDEERRLLVACGGGAGMAAAYNVPLGGAVFAVEILLGSLSLRAVVPALAASMLATWASWLLLPDQPTYTISASGASMSLMLWAAVAGPACGLLTVPFIRLLARAKSVKPEGWQIAMLPILSLAVLGLVSTRFPEMLGNGKDVVQVTFSGAPAVSLLLVLLLLRPLATASILRSGVPGGLFTPAMTLGAVAGLLLGRAWAILLPHTSVAGQLPTCAFIGAGAILAASTGGPVSAVIFMLELTGTGEATIVPLLIAVVSATFVAQMFERRSIYSIEAERTGNDGSQAKPLPSSQT